MKLRDLDKDDAILDEHFSNDKSVKVSAAAQLHWQNHRQDRLQSLEQVYARDDWQTNVRQANKLKAQDPQWRQRHQASYNEEINQRRSTSLKETLKDPVIQQKRSQQSRKNWTTDYRFKMQKCVKTNLGVFASVKEAAETHGMSPANFSTAMKRTSNQLKGWCYITREQYEAQK